MSAARLAVSAVALAFCSACGQPPPTERPLSTHVTTPSSTPATTSGQTPGMADKTPAPPPTSAGVSGQAISPRTYVEHPGGPGGPGPGGPGPGGYGPAVAVPKEKPVSKADAPLVAARGEYEKAVGTGRSLTADAIGKATAEHRKRLATIQEQETKAGNLDAAVAARDEGRRIDAGLAVNAKVETAEDLRGVMPGTVWSWDKDTLQFAANATAFHRGFGGNISWVAVDRRTVMLMRSEASGKSRLAVLQFSEWLDRFEGYDFDGKRIEAKSRVTDKK